VQNYSQLELFEKTGNEKLDGAFPAIHADVYETLQKTPYLTEPGVVLIAQPRVNLSEVYSGFLDNYDPGLQFDDYARDPTTLPDAETLTKFAGQLCYLSFGPKRSPNASAAQYFENILSSGHGSVLEHAQFSFLFYGISRSLTHELVRHRAGFSFSQVSQRYVDGTKLRFVCRPEFSDDPVLFEEFKERIDFLVSDYERIAEILKKKQEKLIDNFGDAFGSKADLRKMVNQVARAILPNEAEAPIVVSANLRAWRHFLNMRGSLHAETEIRGLALRVAKIFQVVCPLLFADVQLALSDLRGRYVDVRYPKV